VYCTYTTGVAKNRANNPDQHRANKTDQQSSMDLKVVAERIANEWATFQRDTYRESRQHALAIKRSQTFKFQ
jgi:hypothetical protein